jgi:two-component system, sensor histidine kinase
VRTVPRNRIRLPTVPPSLGIVQRATGFIRAAALGLNLGSRTVHGKLLRAVMVTTLTALLIAGAAMLTSDLVAYRHSAASDLMTESNILALSTAPALAFDDSKVAQQDLNALRARPGLLVAALYDAHGRLFAQYVTPGVRRPPSFIAPAALAKLSGTADTLGEVAEVYQPIRQQGEWLGTIYLRGRYSVLARLRAYLEIFSLVAIASLALALVLSRQLQQAITTPLGAIAEVARRIMQERDYSLRAQRVTDDEIGIVVDAFNGMLDEVQAGNRALREADRRKDEFLATLAHELRNPLAPIRHATQILNSEEADERQRRWAREIIARQVQRMALLLDDLLDVSRITQGRFELRREPVDLAMVVNSAVEVARPLLEAKRHLLEIDLPAQPMRIEADPLRLSQALSNLLTNAAKYTDPEGRITLRAAAGHDEITIEIEDNGIGLTREALAQLFQPFTQIKASESRSEGGLGIGLALVKGLIELHNGTVEGSSAGLGHGTKFTIRLPATATSNPPVSKPRSEAQPVTRGRLRKVLVVDDNRDAAETLAAVLRMSGHTVSVAYDARDALRVAAREQPEVCILDIGLPEMSGYELARRIRQESWGEIALLIALTGWGQPADKQRALVAGFDRHLTKPVHPDEVERLLAESHTRFSGRVG